MNLTYGKVRAAQHMTMWRSSSEWWSLAQGPILTTAIYRIPVASFDLLCVSANTCIVPGLKFFSNANTQVTTNAVLTLYLIRKNKSPYEHPLLTDHKSSPNLAMKVIRFLYLRVPKPKDYPWRANWRLQANSSSFSQSSEGPTRLGWGHVYVSFPGFSGEVICSLCKELVKNLGKRQDMVRSRWPLNPGTVSWRWWRCRGRWRALLCSRPKRRKTPPGSCYIKRGYWHES